MNIFELEYLSETKWSLTLKQREIIIMRRYGVEEWEVLEEGVVIEKFRLHFFQDALAFAYFLLEGE